MNVFHIAFLHIDICVDLLGYGANTVAYHISATCSIPEYSGVFYGYYTAQENIVNMKSSKDA